MARASRSAPRLDGPTPLPCEHGPACCTRSYTSAADAETLFREAREVLVAMSASDVAVNEAAHRADATFRVVVFTDDVAVVVTPGERSGSVLHVRSRSRVGRFDFGVNNRRLRRFVRRVVARTGPLTRLAD